MAEGSGIAGRGMIVLGRGKFERYDSTTLFIKVCTREPISFVMGLRIVYICAQLIGDVPHLFGLGEKCVSKNFNIFSGLFWTENNLKVILENALYLLKSY